MNRIKVFLMVAVFFFSVDAGMAQSDKSERKEQRKIEKAEKKRLKEEQRKERQDLLMSLVHDQNFVLEAYSLAGRYSNRYEVSPSTNFVMIEGNQITLQTANNFRFGYNGLGGVTIQGTILDYEIISKNKNGASVLVQFHSPVIGHTTLNLSMQANGQAQARMVDNWGRRITFQGSMVAPEESRVFEGRPLI